MKTSIEQKKEILKEILEKMDGTWKLGQLFLFFLKHNIMPEVGVNKLLKVISIKMKKVKKDKDQKYIKARLEDVQKIKHQEEEERSKLPGIESILDKIS